MARIEGARTVVLAAVVATAFFLAILVGNLMVFSGGHDPDVDFQTQQVQGTIPPAETVDGDHPLEFEDVSDEVGFDYAASNPYRAGVTGSIYAADVNSNGYEDLLGISGGSPKLYRNGGGEYDHVRTFGVEHARSALFLDYDNDGDEDLLLMGRGEVPVLYENDGGEFDRTDAGFSEDLVAPYGAAAADFTGNGCLDVFVYQYGQWFVTSPLDRETAREVFERHPEVRPETNTGTRNRLYAGDCGSFEDVTDEAGIRGEDWSFTAAAVDFTGDGHTDLLVTNDFTRDFLYVNTGSGEFERRDMGPASDRNAMSSAVTDVNGDGLLDVYVTNIWFDEDLMTYNHQNDYPYVGGGPVLDGNNLFINDGDGNFTDRAPEYGVQRGGWGWGAVFADLTNSGEEDLAHATRPMEPGFVPYDQYGVIQLWVRSNDTFERLDGRERGFATEETHGLVSVDYDADGTQDLAAGVTPWLLFDPDAEPSYRLYENRIDSTDALQFFVRNPDGLEVNAEVYVETADGETVYRVVNSKAGYSAQDSRMVHVGTRNTTVESVRVEWPDGSETTYPDLRAGNRYVLTPGDAEHVTELGESEP